MRKVKSGYGGFLKRSGGADSQKIVYFLGEYCNQQFAYQKEELTDALLLDYETAMSLFQFESSKRILTEANDFLLGR